MTAFDLGGRKPVYATPDGAILFFPNPSDGPGAYDVIIRDHDHFYIHDRTLGDLTSPEISTQRMMQSLETMCGWEVRHILKSNALSPEQMHVALLQLRIQEQERQIRDAYVVQRVV